MSTESVTESDVDLLIDAADRLLSERVAATLTVRDIARAAGVPVGALYEHFEGKLDLLLAAALRRWGAVAARFEQAVPMPGTFTVEQDLAACARACLELHAGALPILGALMSEPVLLARFVEAVHGAPTGPDRLLHVLGEYVLGEQSLGRLPAGDPRPATTLLFGSALVLALGGLFGDEDPAVHLDPLVGTLLNGLAAGPVAES